jgi:lipopolysaccharide/colanic/teichoic acid biosynthesis glycosyltransferase
MRRYGALAADLCWVAFTPFLALLIRDNFVFYLPHWEAITAYAAISFATCVAAFAITGSHKTLWQYTSLPDVLRIIAVVTVGLLLAVSISFVGSRLEGVARSVPVIHWFVLVSAIVGTRVAFRIWHERTTHDRSVRSEVQAQNVLILGEGPLTELYLRSVVAYGSKAVVVVGILSDRIHSGGRRLRQQEILGTPEQLLQVIDRLEVHGVIVKRIAVMQPLEELSNRAAEALSVLERSSSVKVDWIIERLGLTPAPVNGDDGTLHASLEDRHTGLPSRATSETEVEILTLGQYGYVKRVLDLLATLVLTVLLAPLVLAIGLLVCLDVGFPVVFWQQRPGRFAHPFKLFKFRTMGPAHDAQGNRISEDQRSSNIGRLLRNTRLDELPQLYNILVGDMSFIGPRPLLHIEQPEDMSSRLSVRPGLTGFAQVYGGRNISIEDKNALDIWYIRNASLWLDVKLLLLTTLVLVRGERVDHATLRAAREDLEPPQRLVSPTSCPLIEQTGIGAIRPAA